MSFLIQIILLVWVKDLKKTIDQNKSKSLGKSFGLDMNRKSKVIWNLRIKSSVENNFLYNKCLTKVWIESGLFIFIQIYIQQFFLFRVIFYLRLHSWTISSLNCKIVQIKKFPKTLSFCFFQRFAYLVPNHWGWDPH